MKSFRILTAVLLASVFAFLTACQPDEISTGIDGKKPGVTNLGLNVASHGATALTVTWSAESAIKAGATSFSVQLVESPDTTGGRLIAADVYNSTISKTVAVEDGVTDYAATISGQTLGDKLYLRVRANYKMSKYSDWTWLEDANGNKLIYKVGRGVISEGLESPYLYKVTGTSTGIIVKWDAIEGATGYVIQYKRATDADFTAVTLTAAQAGARPVHKIEGLPSETAYIVRAKTVTPEGDSDYTEEVAVSTRVPGSFPKVMSTAAELIDWLESGVVEVNPGEEYSISADIDLAGQSFTAMDESMLGIFNGNDHTISGVASTLFYSNEGTIKNLKVTGAIESSDATVAGLVVTNRGTITDVNVNIPITYAIESDAEMRIAGIAINNEDGATIVNTTNEGAIKVNATANLKAPVLAAGIAAYSKGTIDNCTNNGDVSLNSGNTIRGVAIAGIVAYLEGKAKASVNNGGVSISALYSDGYCDIINTTGTSANTGGNSASPAVAGIAAYGNGTGFEIDGCNNKGSVSYSLASIDSYSSAAHQRTQVAGIVANPYGNVKNCINDGAVSVNVMSSSGDVYTTKGHIICAGGIGGGDWFAGADQDKSSYTDCTNNGNLSIYIASNASNSAVGGIVGWPGKEGSRTNKTSGCVNNGKITLTGPGKVRCGGIHGGSGIIENSTNNGDISVTSGTNCAVGGISGFTSNGLKITGVKNYGNITAVPDGTYVGGLAGNLGNSAGAGGYTGKCVVRCTIRVGESSNAYTGMVIGYYNGTSASTPAGSDSSPISISGKYAYGSTTVALTSANYKNYLCGTTNYSADSHPIFTTFDSTPYTDSDSGSDEPENPDLEAPANVTTTVMYNYIDVSWDAVNGAEWYVVEYKKEGDAAWTASAKILETTYRIEGLDHDASYIVRVKAYASTSSGYSSEEAIVTLEEVNLAAPVVVLTSKATSITAEWAAVSKATGYIVEYKKTADAEWTVASENVEGLTYTIAKLTPEISYDVRVRTLGEGGNMSAEYSAVQTIATIALAYTYPLVISTAQDFLEWLSGAAPTCTSTDEVSLGADINLAGETLVPADSFAGIFDGAGHSIKNLSGTTPLFLQNTGTIKNLIIDASSSFAFAADDNKIFGPVAAQSSGSIKDCVNNAAITITSAADKAANAYLVGGVVGQTSGVVSGCKNYGAVKLTGKAIFGTMVAGVVGYAAANVEDCENHGAVTLEFTYSWQKVAVSYIPLVKEKLVPGVSGVVGISQNDAKVLGCKNYGTVTFKETTVEKIPANMNRHGIAGILAVGGGNVENCRNEGAINAICTTSTRAALTAYENILGVGGIAGHGYNAANQNAMSIKDCVNTGAITVDYDIQKSNTTIGGIVGWLGVESNALTMTVDGCSNTGNITISGTGKGRFGGISGGTANVMNCTNNATMTVNSADAASVAALGIGFHTQAHNVYGNTFEGTLAVNCKIDGAGGMYGGQGNAAEDGSKTYNNNVNATINTDATTTNVGLVVGKFSTGTTNAAVVLGTAGQPIKVKGKVNGIDITAENFANYLFNGGNAVDNKTVNAAFWE